MVVESIPNPIEERIQRFVHASGLTVYLNPRPSFTRTMGLVGTRFGSLDHTLPSLTGGAPQVMPDGVAHFLEHKLFESETGDLSLEFSARGASCNAATEFSKTSYHFSCADQVEENLDTLLRLVSQPHFTDENVHKEQGIIEQEIRMYDDDPDWRLFFRLMEAMYHHHPVRLNIAGSVESIQEITPELLHRCHQVFYHPANMVLVLSGGFDPERVTAQVDRTLGQLEFGPGQACVRQRVDEPTTVQEHRAQLSLPVVRPQVSLGFKDRILPSHPADILRRDLASRLLLDVLFSQSSRLHQELYEKGIVDDSFDVSYSGEEDFGFTVLSGECDEPEAFREALVGQLDRARQEGLDAEDMERMRRRFLGQYTRTFNSVEAMAGTLVSCHMKGILPGDYLEVADSLTREELEQRLREHLTDEACCMTVLHPAPRGGAPVS